MRLLPVFAILFFVILAGFVGGVGGGSGTGCNAPPKANTLHYERAVVDQQDRRIERLESRIVSLEDEKNVMAATRHQLHQATLDLQQRVGAIEEKSKGGRP